MKHLRLALLGVLLALGAVTGASMDALAQEGIRYTLTTQTSTNWQPAIVGTNGFVDSAWTTITTTGLTPASLGTAHVQKAEKYDGVILDPTHTYIVYKGVLLGTYARPANSDKVQDFVSYTSGSGVTLAPNYALGTLTLGAGSGLPAQSGNAGKVLSTNGTVASWIVQTGGDSAALFIAASPGTPAVLPKVTAGTAKLAIGDGATIDDSTMNVGTADHTLAIGTAHATGFWGTAINTGVGYSNFYGPMVRLGAGGGADNTQLGGGPSFAAGYGSAAGPEGSVALCAVAGIRAMAFCHGVAIQEFCSAMGDGSVAGSNYSHCWFSNGMPCSGQGNVAALFSPGGTSIAGRTTGLTGTAGLFIQTGGGAASGLHSTGIAAPQCDITSDYGFAEAGVGLNVQGYVQHVWGQYNLPRASVSLTALGANDCLWIIGNGTGAGGGRSNALEYYNNGKLILNGVQVTNTSGQLLPAAFATAVPIANGGSGQTTANDALNAFLPTQTSNANKALVTDGTNTSWSQISLTAGVTGTLPSANGGTGFSTYTTGQIIYASATNTLSKLGIGSTNQVLKVVSGAPAWATISTGSLYLVDPGTSPTVTPTVTSSTDGLSLGSGAVVTTGARGISIGNSYTSGVDAITIQGGDHSGTYGAQAARSFVNGLNNLVVSGSVGGAILGGEANQITGNGADHSITGGDGNIINDIGGYAHIGGGYFNTCNSNQGVISGGNDNTETGDLAFIGGGLQNLVSGREGSIPGGEGVVATGYAQTSIGFYNKAVPTSANVSAFSGTAPALIIGNGGDAGTRSSAAYVTFDGKLYLSPGALTALPVNDISFGGTASRTIGVERQTTAATAGSALTIKSGTAVSGGTDLVGGDITSQTGVGTGAGVPARLLYKAPTYGSSGTTDQILVTRSVSNATKTGLTTGSATSLFEIALPASTSTGCTVQYTIEANDGTDFQAIAGVVNVAGVNKAGSYTTNTSVANQVTTGSVGTITSSWSVTTGTNKITVQVTPTVVGITATTLRITYNVYNGGPTDITIK